MKRMIITMLVALAVVTQSCSFALASEAGMNYLDLQFENGELIQDKTGWSLNTPTAEEIDGHSVAKMTNTTNGYLYYTFEMKNMSLKGDLVIETRVKQTTNNTFLIKGFMNSGASLGYSSMMSRYVNPSLGPVWVNSDNTSVIMDNYQTDVNSLKPDMEIGWDTVYIHVNTEDGTYRSYVNNSSSYMEGKFAGNSDNYLHSLRFGVPNVTANDPAPDVYIDYIKIYSADLLDIPEISEHNMSVETNFDEYEEGTNLRKSLFGYVTDDNTLANVTTDPTDNDNKCVRLYSNPGSSSAARYGASALFGKKATLEFSAYLPQNADTDLLTLYTDTSSLASVYGSADGTLSFGSTSCSADMTKWSDIKYEVDLTASADNVQCYIDNNLVATKTLVGNKLLGLRFGIPLGNNQGLYIDNVRFYTNDGTCQITPSLSRGKVQYGDVVTLTPSDPSAIIYYTTDGSKPDEVSAVYDNGIEINQNNMVIKAVGYVDGIAGKTYTFGSYTLNSIEGIIIAGINPTDKKVSVGSTVSVDFSVLNTWENRSVAMIVGVYDNGKLIGYTSEDVSLNTGLNDKTVSFTAPTYTYVVPEIRAFVWNSLEKGRIFCEYVTNSESKEGEAASFPVSEDKTSLRNVQYSLNSTDAILTVSGSVENPTNAQDVSIVMSNKENGDICAITQAYINTDGKFKASVPVRADISGGFYDVYVGGRKIDNRVNGSVYYVDDQERAAGVSKINAAARSEIITVIEDLCTNSILDIDIENATYVADKEKIADIFYNSKTKKALINIEDAIHVFNESIAMTDVLNADEHKYFETILKNKDIFGFMNDNKYSFDDSIDFAAANSAFSAQLSPLPTDIYAFETAYKAARALSVLNSAQRSEISNVLVEYNDIFVLNLTGDYKNVSSYEVAKALYNKDFKDIESVQNVFNTRVKELKNEMNSTSSSSGGGGGGGGGGGSTGYKNNNTVLASPNVENTPIPQNKEDNIFTDVKSSHWAYNAIEKLTDKNIINGFDNKTFRPDDGITRAEFVKMLVTAFGYNNSSETEVFTDIKSTDWYYGYVMTAYDLGIVNGDGEKFNPSALINRADMAVMVYRIISDKASENEDAPLNFTDNDLIADYAKKAVSYMSQNGVIDGFDDGSFKPNKTLTRAEGAKILYAIVEK